MIVNCIGTLRNRVLILCEEFHYFYNYIRR